MGKLYKWGILGPGKIAHRWAEGLKLTEGSELHAIGSRSEGRAKDFASEHGFQRYYGSYRALVSDPDLDVVYVASPHSHHHEHTMLCLEAGKSVVCEKAFAINGKEVREMVALAREKDLFLMEALWPPFQPSYEYANSILATGKLGEIVTMRSVFAFKPAFEPELRLYNPELGGGALLDIGIYPVIDALTYLGVPDTINAVASFAETGVDDNIDVLFSYRNGKSASLYATLKSGAGTSTDIVCENGIISLKRLSDGSQLTKIEVFGDEPGIKIFKPEARGFQFESREVIKCLEKGMKESEVVPLSFSIDLIDTLDRIREICGIVYKDRE